MYICLCSRALLLSLSSCHALLSRCCLLLKDSFHLNRLDSSVAEVVVHRNILIFSDWIFQSTPRSALNLKTSSTRSLCPIHHANIPSSQCRLRLWHRTRSGLCFCPWDDHHHLCTQEVQLRGSDLGDVQHGRENRQIRSRCQCCCLFLDLGCHVASILWSGISIWRLGALLVCFRSYRSNLVVRNSGN